MDKTKALLSSVDSALQEDPSLFWINASDAYKLVTGSRPQKEKFIIGIGKLSLKSRKIIGKPYQQSPLISASSLYGMLKEEAAKENVKYRVRYGQPSDFPPEWAEKKMREYINELIKL